MADVCDRSLDRGADVPTVVTKHHISTMFTAGLSSTGNTGTTLPGGFTLMWPAREG